MNYSNPNINPFKSLPKDAPVRVSKDGPGNRAVSGNYESSRGNFGNNNFRGRGGYGNRGAMNNMGGGFRGNFTAGMNNRGSFQGQNGGFQGNNMGGGFGNFNNGMMNVMRGGAGGFRGGRGGMSTGMGNGMMGIPMGGVPMPMGSMGGMGGMGGPMGMNNMGGGMPGMKIPTASQDSLSAHFHGLGQTLVKGRDSTLFQDSRPPRGNDQLNLCRATEVEQHPAPSLCDIPQFQPCGQLPQGSPSCMSSSAKQNQQHTGAGFQGMQQQFNPTFFQQQSPANDWQNPHGAKRQRPE